MWERVRRSVGRQRSRRAPCDDRADGDGSDRSTDDPTESGAAAGSTASPSGSPSRTAKAAPTATCSHGECDGGGGDGPIGRRARVRRRRSEIAASPVDDIAPPEAGPLRAGSVDDNADFAGYLEYLERIHSFGISLRDFDPTGRIVVTVTGTSGLPVAGAEVVVSAGGVEVARLRTTADGTARFHPLAYGAPDATSFDFTVGAQTVSAEPGGVATFSADAAGGATAPVAVDVLFLLDATGSMGDEIDQLKTSIDSVAARLSSLDSAPDIRFAMTLYRDVDDTFVTSTYDFTSDVEAFRSALSNVVADGGGDYPEALDEGLAESLAAPAWRDPASTIQLIFLVADAPPQVGRQLQGNGYPDVDRRRRRPRHQDLPGRLLRERRPGRGRLPPGRPGDRCPVRVPLLRRRLARRPVAAPTSTPPTTRSSPSTISSCGS